ncbi:MAG: hypothetical protein H6713_29590 [Myxococcales bacterium]|nr:hypothetical protein [Myxococcales bacterium]MCB9754116.1 hypothetical protein [Myxococcales bacterium]
MSVSQMNSQPVDPALASLEPLDDAVVTVDDMAPDELEPADPAVVPALSPEEPAPWVEASSLVRPAGPAGPQATTMTTNAARSLVRAPSITGEYTRRLRAPR